MSGTRSHRPSNADEAGHGGYKSHRPSMGGDLSHRPSMGGDLSHRPSMMGDLDQEHGSDGLLSHRPSMGGDQRQYRPSNAGGRDHDVGNMSHRQSTVGGMGHRDNGGYGPEHGMEHRESMMGGMSHRPSVAGGDMSHRSVASERQSLMGDMSHRSSVSQRQPVAGDMSHRPSVARGGARRGAGGAQGLDAAHHNTHPPATVHPWETTIHLSSGRVHQAFAAYILDFGNIARYQTKVWYLDVIFIAAIMQVQLHSFLSLPRFLTLALAMDVR